MNPSNQRARAVRARALVVAAILAHALPVHAASPGPLDDAAVDASEAAGPLALSADGRFRVHVDSAGTLRRVELADHTHATAMPLGVRALALAASRTAQKVAIVTGAGCLGIADFGAQPPAVAWAPMSAESAESGEPDLLASRWAPRPADACESDGDRIGAVPALALSADGKLLAWREAVVEVETHRLVARLPAEPKGVRFVDDDRKLFANFVASGYVDEGLGGRDSAQVVTWDLATGELHDVLTDDHGTRTAASHLFASYSPATGLAWWADTTRWELDTRHGPNDEMHTTLPLVAARPGSCGAPALRAKLEDAGGDVFIVDPFGRWMASYANPSPYERPADGPGASTLTFIDLATGRAVETRSLAFALRGLVASPDGAALLALAAPFRNHETGVRASALRGVTPGDEVREFAVPKTALASPRDTLAGWTASACLAEDEIAGARRLPPAGGPLAVAWTQSLPPPGAAPASAAETGGSYPAPAAFVRPDGSLWLARSHDLAQLDPASGRVLRTQPLPAGDKATSRYAAATDGFVNALGDTLTWRPASGGGTRRVIDQRAGWSVEGIDVRGRAVLAVWRPKPGTPPPNNENGDPDPNARRFVFYDIASGALVSDQLGSDVGGDYTSWDVFSRDVRNDAIAPCHDEAGARSTGFDWRVDMFGSVRAWRCGPEGARTVLWQGTALRRDRTMVPRVDVEPPAMIVGDGPIGVVQQGLAWRVFDAKAHAEVGRIDPIDGKAPLAAAVAPESRLVIVETATQLIAYRLP